MVRVLVTGGAGFIGSAVIRSLRHNHPDIAIRALDLLPPKEIGVEYVLGSVLDVNNMLLAVRECDYVIHLAAMVGIQRTETWPLQCLNVNVQGTVNILEACARERVKKVVFASSSEVYGEAAQLPVSEESPLNARSPYAVSKLAAEGYVQAYAERFEFDWSIIRPFNVYGPGQVSEFVVPRFILAVQQGTRPVVYGDGGQLRTFCYVDDTADGMAAALFVNAASGRIFNLGNPNCTVSISELALKVAKLLGSDTAPEYVPFSRANRLANREIRDRIPDISRAAHHLSFSPSVGLDEGIMRVVESGPLEESWIDPLHDVAQPVDRKKLPVSR